MGLLFIISVIDIFREKLWFADKKKMKMQYKKWQFEFVENTQWRYKRLYPAFTILAEEKQKQREVVVLARSGELNLPDGP